MEVYDPLGVYEVKSGKVEGEIAIILPPDLNADRKKFKVDKLAEIDISFKGSKPEGQDGANGIFLVIGVKDAKDHHVKEDLSKKQLKSNYSIISLKTDIENFNLDDKKCRFIVFHSNDFSEGTHKDVINCARDFIREHTYDPDFEFKAYCAEKGMAQPDTAGGGILVGTGG